MDVFDLRGRLVSDYRDYTRSFIKIRDPRISGFVDGILDAEGFWPEPLLQLNPTFSPGGTIDDLVTEGVLHEQCSRIFRIGKSDADPGGRRLRPRHLPAAVPFRPRSGGRGGAAVVPVRRHDDEEPAGRAADGAVAGGDPRRRRRGTAVETGFVRKLSAAGGRGRGG